MNRKSRAFTLIELLVVIAVIAVLAGLVLSVTSRIAETGRTVKCASNLKQIGAALFSYANDHNGLMPQAGAVIPYSLPSARDPSMIGWTEQLEPYAGTDRGIYVCPSSKTIIPKNAQYGYFMGCHAAYVAAGKQFAALRPVLLAAPAKYILGGDISSNGVFASADDSDKDDYAQNPAFAAAPPPFHFGKSNILFADGHVAAFAAFDPRNMTTHYGLKDDGTGYSYSE